MKRMIVILSVSLLLLLASPVPAYACDNFLDCLFGTTQIVEDVNDGITQRTEIRQEEQTQRTLIEEGQETQRAMIEQTQETQRQAFEQTQETMQTALEQSGETQRASLELAQTAIEQPHETQRELIRSLALVGQAGVVGSTQLQIVETQTKARQEMVKQTINVVIVLVILILGVAWYRQRKGQTNATQGLQRVYHPGYPVDGWGAGMDQRGRPDHGAVLVLEPDRTDASR